MRIWIDLTNSPHVNFFAGFIGRLRGAGHELVITSRPHANTEQLLRLSGLDFHSVGKHYGKRRRAKLFGFGMRCAQLYRFMAPRQVDVAISHSSFYQPVVARALGIRCLYLNDNEHAAGNEIAFRFADCVLVPEFLDRTKVVGQGARDDKIVAYPGVKEGVYLWEREVRHAPPAKLPTVFVRPEPWLAQYYDGDAAFLDAILADLAADHRVVVLPRGDAQRLHYEQLSGLEVPDAPLSLDEVVETCHLFIGAGGTMTRELAVLGVPTISTYQNELLDVDRFLIQEGCMIHEPTLTTQKARSFLAERTAQPPSSLLLERGRDAAALIERVLLGAQ